MSGYFYLSESQLDRIRPYVSDSGQVSDYKGAALLIGDLPPAHHLLADKDVKGTEKHGLSPCE